MSKNRYKLQPVLGVRERAKQEAAGHVAARRARLAEAEAELLRRRQLVEDCRARQHDLQQRGMEELKGGTKARHVVASRAHLADLRQSEQELIEKVVQQEKVLARAEAELEQSLAALVEAARELQIIEKHRDEWLRRTRRAEQRGEQKLSDEIGAIIHGRHKHKE